MRDTTLKIKIGIVCLALVVLAPLAVAYPLSGSNGVVNATVLGTYRDGDTIMVDIMVTGFGIYFPGMNLVDIDDNFYRASFGSYVGVFDGHFGTDGRSTVRASYGDRRIVAFEGVPQNIEIKRIRIQPNEPYDLYGDPFSIEWNGVPEFEGTPLSLKFYGLDNSGYSWTLNVKLKNTGTDILELQTPCSTSTAEDEDGFYLGDQFGFYYPGQVTKAKLLPGESIKTTINFRDISKLSRPVDLIYVPSDLKIDISAWA